MEIEGSERTQKGRGREPHAHPDLTRNAGDDMIRDSEATISQLKGMVKRFNDERDWDQFHNAKDLAMAISAEAAEVLEHFIYKSNDEADEILRGRKREDVEDELADVLWTVLMFAERYDVDISAALRNKMNKSAKKYPIEKARGSNRKYNEL